MCVRKKEQEERESETRQTDRERKRGGKKCNGPSEADKAWIQPLLSSWMEMMSPEMWHTGKFQSR